ncbi:transcriptional regulator [Ochrobactrum sp. MYb29]|nr:transcriptional regulator [Ochrobactrum sp. MYb29]
MNDNFVPPLISLTNVTEATTMSRFLVMALVKEDRFPKPVQLTGQKRIAFVRKEVMEWIESRISERYAA